MNLASIDKPNAVCGAFFIVVGAIFAAQSLAVDLGSWLRIGPGGMPLILSLLLVLLGVGILIQATRSEGESVGVIAWRGMVFILLAPILFGLLVRGAGFVAAVFVTSLVASFASFKMTPLYALVLAALLTIFSTVVFSYGLGLPFERFGPWLRF